MGGRPLTAPRPPPSVGGHAGHQQRRRLGHGAQGHLLGLLPKRRQVQVRGRVRQLPHRHAVPPAPQVGRCHTARRLRGDHAPSTAGGRTPSLRGARAWALASRPPSPRCPPLRRQLGAVRAGLHTRLHRVPRAGVHHEGVHAVRDGRGARVAGGAGAHVLLRQGEPPHRHTQTHTRRAAAGLRAPADPPGPACSATAAPGRRCADRARRRFGQCPLPLPCTQ
jgi:hypothetical protein